MSDLVMIGLAIFIFTALLAATQLIPERVLHFVERLFGIPSDR